MTNAKGRDGSRAYRAAAAAGYGMRVPRMLVVSAVHVALATPAGADLCGDYRAAVVRLEAAEAALDSAVVQKDAPGSFRESLNDPVLGPLNLAAYRAWRDLDDAARALRETIDTRRSDRDRSVAFVIGPIQSAREGLGLAIGRIFWDTKEGTAARSKLLDTMEQTERAYYFSLRFACPEGEP